MPKGRTLPSNRKIQVLRAYRSRGRGNRNLWLVYSYKTNRDWILGSDRHLVHWVIFLETNPDVRTFEIDPEYKQTSGENVSATAELRTGESEDHILKLGQSQERGNSEDICKFHHDSTSLRIFTDADLFPLGEEAMRWLKVINYCASIRDEEQQETRLACISTMRMLKSGTLGQILDALPDFDRQIAIGVFSRMAIQNDIALDLSSSSFNLSSKWTLRASE
jgi:hypothetical protein